MDIHCKRCGVFCHTSIPCLVIMWKYLRFLWGVDLGRLNEKWTQKIPPAVISMGGIAVFVEPGQPCGNDSYWWRQVLQNPWYEKRLLIYLAGKRNVTRVSEYTVHKHNRYVEALADETFLMTMHQGRLWIYGVLLTRSKVGFKFLHGQLDSLVC